MKAIRSIAVVGQGVVPWLAAAMLARVLAPQRVAVTVVESGKDESVPDIATLPSLALLHRALGIAEPAFMRASRATFRLGTQFEGWSGPGSSYFHPLGQTGAAMDGVPFHQFWLKQADAPALAEFSLAAVAAKSSRFTFPAADQRSVLSTLDYGYHLDAVRYAAFLREHARNLGVGAVEGGIVDIVRQAETGFIQEIVLDNGDHIEADLFFDCSQGGLLERDGYEDWSQWFACDRILHMRAATTDAPLAYTRVVAEPAGWRWSLPLQGETGHGYVYSSRHISDNDAASALCSSLGETATGDASLYRFRPGRRTEVWQGNVIALGDAAGAIDPLDCTGLHLVQSALLRLTELFPDRNCGPAERNEFNRLTASEWERARDFTLLHYAIAGRDDTPFWRDSRAVPLPEILRRKIEMFRNRGYVILYDDETFDTQSWASLFLGQGLRPRRLDPLAQQVDAYQNSRMLQRMRSLIRQAADSMASHAVMLERTGATARRPA
jgi:tryptophan halogenase